MPTLLPGFVQIINSQFNRYSPSTRPSGSQHYCPRQDSRFVPNGPTACLSTSHSTTSSVEEDAGAGRNGDKREKPQRRQTPVIAYIDLSAEPTFSISALFLQGLPDSRRISNFHYYFLTRRDRQVRSPHVCFELLANALRRASKSFGSESSYLLFHLLASRKFAFLVGGPPTVARTSVQSPTSYFRWTSAAPQPSKAARSLSTWIGT
jgi:hypothetical protein